jgi:hypothetical protein
MKTYLIKVLPLIAIAGVTDAFCTSFFQPNTYPKNASSARTKVVSVPENRQLPQSEE